MSEWNVCCIDDLGTVNRGKSKRRPRNDSILFGGLYPFIQTADVKKANLYITEYNETYSDIGLAQSKLWDKGTLCITIAANIAESAILGIDACFPDSVVGFIPHKGKSDLKFVKYLLDEFKVYMQQISKGTTQDNLSLEKLRRVKFNVPGYNTQVKIANFLSTYDDLIENNQRRIALLEKAAQELYKEWFVRFRFPGYENTEFVEKRPFGWIVSACEKFIAPSFFDYCEFREIGSFVRGRNITAAEMVDGEIPVISAGLQPSGYHNQANVQGRSLTISASGANAGYLQYNLTDIWAADCSYYQNDKNLWFVYCTLKFLQPVINNLQCGAAQPHVYPKNINKLCVLKPTDELITKFNDTVEPFFKEIEILQKKNDSLVKQRDLLLPRIMRGKLEV